MKLIIAIDGYSSCGKSTLAKAIAKKIDFTYIDSGAYYRAVTLTVLDNKIAVHDEPSIIDILMATDIDFKTGDGESKVLLNSGDVTQRVRSMEVSNSVSKISSLPKVRKAVVEKLQHIGTVKNVVMDGRDIGTKVFPNAHIKFFMNADPQVRAIRRHKELLSKYPALTLQEVFENIQQRDLLDTTRESSPLKIAENAILLDNTQTNIDEQLSIAMTCIKGNTHFHHFFNSTSK